MRSAPVIKICGLSTLPVLEAALDARADMVGFVFFPKSPRHIDLATARALGQAVRGRAQKVALSVDADDALLAGIIGALAPDLLQLHGHETPERVAAVKNKFGLPVMKVLPVATAADLAAVAAYDKIADRLLFDAKPPPGARHPGGNGLSFDWRLIENLDPAVPAMLSGGLDPANVASAIALTGMAGVDVSSGVESAPGVKDVAKIAAFIKNARAAYAALAVPARSRV